MFSNVCALCTSVHSPEIFSNEFAQNQQEIAVKMHQVKVFMKRWWKQVVNVVIFDFADSIVYSE